MNDRLSRVEEEERNKLLRDMARPVVSLNALRKLQQRQREWLRKHPDDEQVIAEGEGLLMLEGCFKR